MTAPQMSKPWTPEPWIENDLDLALTNFLKAARLDKRRILRESRINHNHPVKEQTR